MNNIDYKKVAELLDAVADYVDEIEHRKTAEETSARQARISKLATRYESSTGEALPSQLKEKLANIDHETLDHLLKVANNTGDSPESLGGPAEINDETLPRTTKEAASQAEDKFLSWIVS